MKILVSGGSGFIGRNFINHFIKTNPEIMIIGRNIDFISNNNVKKIILDFNENIQSFQKIIDFNPDCFVHLAWEGIPDYSHELSKRNYINTMRFIKFLITSTDCSKIISSGTCWEYNDGNLEGCCYEDFAINPQKSFSIYKNKIYKEIYSLSIKHNITFNWLRIFYAYGIGQRKDSIIPTLINQIKNKKEINVNFPSNINDYIYIDDIVRILSIFVSDNISSGIYNIGSGVGTEVQDLIKIIDNQINGNNSFSRNYLNKIDKYKRNQNFYACTKKLLKNIKNFEFTDINIGIQKTIESIYV